MDIEHLAAVIGIATGAPLILAFIYKLVRRGERVLQAIQGLQSDLRPNGGSSFADHVNRRFGQLNLRLDEATNTAREAADAATRVEVIGNLDRAEIRRTLSSIQDAALSNGSALQTHLVDAAHAQTKIDERLERIEKLRSA